MKTQGTYEVVLAEGQHMMLGNGRIKDTAWYEVRFSEDDARVWSGRPFDRGFPPRGYKALATKERNNWQRYFERTGKRYEIEQKEERQAKEAARKAERERQQRIADAAPDLLVALKQLTEALVSPNAGDDAIVPLLSSLPGCGDIIPAVINARKAIAKARGQ